jgi:hypothetical protein
MSTTTTTKKQTHEIEIAKFLNVNEQYKVTGVFEVIPKHIEGTQMCEVQLPCKYKDKNITIVVYE